MDVVTNLRSIEDRRLRCLPKGPNSGCGLLWGLCKRPRMHTQRRACDGGLASHTNRRGSTAPRYLVREKQKSGGGQEKQEK